MFRFKVVDKEGKVLGVREKLWQAQALYRDKYKEHHPLQIVALTDTPLNEDWQSFTNNDTNLFNDTS